MPGWDGNGNFVRIYSWVSDKLAGINITASRMDDDTNNITGNGFNNCLTRDGQGSATDDLPMNGFRHTGVGNASMRDEYLALGQYQDGSALFAIAGGTGDALTIALTPSDNNLVDGMVLFSRALAPNTLNNPTLELGTSPAHTILAPNGSALGVASNGGIVANQPLIFQYQLTPPRWFLLNPASGTVQSVAPNAQGASMSVVAASATATMTADYVIVAVGAGGVTYTLNTYSQAVNLAATGTGGMDIGTAPVSGFVALYAIYNPASATTSILACAVATSSGPVYTGANMPTGYTASCLLGIWKTNGSSQFPIGYQTRRKCFFTATVVVSVTADNSAHNVSLSTLVPSTAKTFGGWFSYTMAASTDLTLIMGSNIGFTLGKQQFSVGAGSSTLNLDGAFDGLPLVTAQQFSYQCTNGTTLSILGSNYTF